MPPSPIVTDDAAQLLSRAAEARAMAVGVVSPEARLVLLCVARCYERLAECLTHARRGTTSAPGHHLDVSRERHDWRVSQAA